MAPKRAGLGLWIALALVGACGRERAVQLGAVLPLSGAAGIYGRSIQKGMELALTAPLPTADGRVAIALSVQDSGGDPERAASQAAQLYADGALAVIGGVTSAEALAMVPVANAAQRVLLSPSASNPELTGISRRFCRVFVSDAREGAMMADFATQTRKVASAVILATDDAYGRGIQQVFESEFERQGSQVLSVIEFTSGEADPAALVDRALAQRPAAVYVAAYAEDVADVLPELRARDFPGDVYTTSAFATPEAIARAGSAGDGVFLTQVTFDADAPRVRDFAARYRTRYGEDPDLYAAHGYDAVAVLAAAAAADRDGAASDFWKALRGVRGVEGVTGLIEFDERGDVQKFPRVYLLDGGRLRDFEREVESQRRALLERLRELEGRTAEHP